MTPLLYTPAAAAPLVTRHIRLATTADVALLTHLQATYSDALGWLPACTHERYINARQVMVIEENGHSAGYLNWIPAKTGVCRIPQVAVHPDLLRTGIGQELIHRLRTAALAGGCTMLRLTSRSDLECNAIWPLLGFVPTGYQRPRNTRRRPLIEWSMPLYSPAELALALTHHTGRCNYTPPAATPRPSLELLTCATS